MSAMAVYKQQGLHRVVVKTDKGETVHSFGTLELAQRFAESVTDGTVKYMGPNAT